jgi:hypothetical protein
MTMRRTGTGVLVLIVVLAFAGVAAAGNGNGNGKGNQGDAPGNSADAPGQVKKDAPAAAPAATTTTTVSTVAPAATTTAPAAPSAAANSSGVKPSNETTHNTHAEAQSNKTKQYGNGQTAGQIAEQNGAGGNAVLHGPGNSQPHKLAPCAGGHEVDVHALKSHRSGSCSGPKPQPQPDPLPKSNPDRPVVTTTPTSTPGEKAPTDPGSKPAQGGTAGEETSAPGDAEGVLSATQRIGHAATLPFTGQRLWIAVLLGVLMIATGLVLREIRTVEAPVESGHDHTDRSRHAVRSTGASIGGRSSR